MLSRRSDSFGGPDDATASGEFRRCPAQRLTSAIRMQIARAQHGCQDEKRSPNGEAKFIAVRIEAAVRLYQAPHQRWRDRASAGREATAVSDPAL